MVEKTNEKISSSIKALFLYRKYCKVHGATLEDENPSPACS
jgi:hypothetical protein